MTTPDPRRNIKYYKDTNEWCCDCAYIKRLDKEVKHSMKEDSCYSCGAKRPRWRIT
jgi:hypothetical protein